MSERWMDEDLLYAHTDFTIRYDVIEILADGLN